MLNASLTPPFTIEDQSDGGDELRMKYRFLDLRRNPLRNALMLRHRMAHEIRNFLDSRGFLEIETPYLIKSTPEGARDFIVPSRMNPGEFYALPQSPQTFKQLLMVAGYDRYFQIVRCFRDEDLRADRQPEFTQIDCEMSFVDREDVLNVFEGSGQVSVPNDSGQGVHRSLPAHTDGPRLWNSYGSDKPDLRFGMTFNDLSKEARGKGFGVFDSAEYIGAICAEGCAGYTRKQLDALTEFVKRPQIGAKGLVYVRCEADGSYRVERRQVLRDRRTWCRWAARCGAKPGDLLLILSGPTQKARSSALCELRLEMGERLGLRRPRPSSRRCGSSISRCSNGTTRRSVTMRCTILSRRPRARTSRLFDTDPGRVRANAYDFVVNGVEVGGGSIRIFDSELQQKMFRRTGLLGTKRPRSSSVS